MNELHYAAYCGDLDAVRHWIGRGDEPDAVDEVGNTALHWNSKMACAAGDRLAIIDELVGAGASINSRNHQDQTPLASAVEATASDEFVGQLRHHGGI